jgi:glycine hydroxymethyltransferase
VSAAPNCEKETKVHRQAELGQILAKTRLHDGYFTDPCAGTDPEIAALIAREYSRQVSAVELVASENFVSRAVLEVQGSVLTNKTVVGYPGRRFHAGAEYADAIERIAVKRACELFSCAFANVQPHSGIQANLAVFRAVLTPEDTVLSLSGEAGGHFSHGSHSNMSGAMARAVFYSVCRDTALIDYQQVHDLALKHRPKLIVAGGAAYPRIIDFPRLRVIADEVGALILVDIAHFAGLVVAGVYPNPFPQADIVTTTTYKSLRGARGGIILTNDGAIAEALDRATVPGVQGSPLLHAVAGKAVCLGEALRPEFRAYGRAVLDNAQRLAKSLLDAGNDVVTSGTDTPLVIADLRRSGLKGQPLVESLDRAGITCNRCELPFDDTDPAMTSGLRFGLSACTTRGLGQEDVAEIGHWINELVAAHASGADKIAGLEAQIRSRAATLMASFPLYA